MDKKDYSLLRPFDLEAAERGEPTCWDDGSVAEFVAYGADGRHCFRLEDDVLALHFADSIRMAPLAWIEGRPVYKDDVLYSCVSGVRYVASSDGAIPPKGMTLKWDNYTEGVLTWTAPTVKREGWINLYPGGDGFAHAACASHPYRSKQEADARAGEGRLACVRVEWEEPARKGGA